ncbi:MAG TPA: hypothetical protein VIM22_08220 [Solirubrobacteraceae bacterium]
MLCRALLLALALTALLSASAFARVLIVTKRSVSYPHLNTIQKAVNKARKGDWVLIDKGKYPETVKVKTAGLHLRGVDRNKVIVDGRHRKNVNGIEVSKANGVYIENLTVRNFDRPNSGGDNGNEIWWNGGDGSGKIGMSGWYGQYLTTYDTGLLGGYGIFMSNAVNGSLKHVYASGFNDSGVYLGACRDCHGLIDDATVERSALGYSGTNSGGHIVVKNSTFRNNSVGVSPNSLNNDDQPPPQDGACDSGSNTTPTPTFASTDVQRCTIFEHNTVVNNNNLTAPANPTLLRLPWGIGFELPGTYADLIRNNTIKGNPNFGILAHENPDPYPPVASTIEFQVSGMRFENNKLSGNGTRAGGADIGLEGGAFGTGSVNNCFTGNTFATSNPANIEGTWGCQNATTPQGGVDLLLKILALVDESSARHQKAQKAPGNQKTMPRPCRGVPKNKLCG